uniref:Uncharacterized protein n=2 Tax=Aegilops tauschii subsp. strangulata TaxID=200361 RepID=A0A453C769_AEGTS
TGSNKDTGRQRHVLTPQRHQWWSLAPSALLLVTPVWDLVLLLDCQQGTAEAAKLILFSMKLPLSYCEMQCQVLSGGPGRSPGVLTLRPRVRPCVAPAGETKGDGGRVTFGATPA